MENRNLTNENDVMKTLKKREKSKKKRIAIIAAVGVVAIAGVSITSGMRRAREAMQDAVTVMQTGEVTNRPLIKSVGATGTIASIDSKSISASISNVEVESVLVEIGDMVTAGQELLYFDTDDIEESLADAKKNLSNANAINNINAEEAARGVTEAERNYESMIEAAQDRIDNTQYVKIADALYNFELYFKDLSEEDKANKKAQLEQWLEETKGAYEDAVEAYEDTVATQENMLASAKNNQTAANLRLNTDNEKNQVELYEEQLAEGIVTAPISGIVTAVNYEEGDTYVQGNTIITIQDCSAFEVEAYIGEYDISDIEKGQKVLIKTDATGDTELEGTVVFVSPTAGTSMTSGNMTSGSMAGSSVAGSSMAGSSMTGGDVSYLVRISVDTPNERLRLDMSASLSIIIEQHENAMTVPYNAIQEDEQGNTYVEVVEEDGTTTKVPVTVVMESNYYTEIKSESLTEGQKVRVIDAESGGIFDMFGGRGGF